MHTCTWTTGEVTKLGCTHNTQTNTHTSHTNTHICRSIYTVATVSLLAGCHSTRGVDRFRSPSHLALPGVEGNDTINTWCANRHPTIPTPPGPAFQVPSCCAPISTSCVALPSTQQQLFFHAPRITQQPITRQKVKWWSTQTDSLTIGEKKNTKKKNKKDTDALKKKTTERCNNAKRLQIIWRQKSSENKQEGEGMEDGGRSRSNDVFGCWLFSSDCGSYHGNLINRCPT